MTFPVADGYVSSDRTALAFTDDGTVGFALVFRRPFSDAKLFSFSTTSGLVTGEFDLVPDFGDAGSSESSRPISLKVHSTAGIVAIYGQNANDGAQKVLAVSFDTDGRLQKLWTATFPSIATITVTDLEFSTDGSRLFVIYSDPPTTGDVVQAEFHRMELTDMILGSSTWWRPFMTRATRSGLVNSVTPIIPLKQHLAIIGSADARIIATADLSVARLQVPCSWIQTGIAPLLNPAARCICSTPLTV